MIVVVPSSNSLFVLQIFTYCKINKDFLYMKIFSTKIDTVDSTDMVVEFTRPIRLISFLILIF